MYLDSDVSLPEIHGLLVCGFRGDERRIESQANLLGRVGEILEGVGIEKGGGAFASQEAELVLVRVDERLHQRHLPAVNRRSPATEDTCQSAQQRQDVWETTAVLAPVPTGRKSQKKLQTHQQTHECS